MERERRAYMKRSKGINEPRVASRVGKRVASGVTEPDSRSRWSRVFSLNRFSPRYLFLDRESQGRRSLQPPGSPRGVRLSFDEA